MDLDFLDSPQGESVVAPEPQADVVETPQDEPKGPVRGPDGKFVAKDAQPEPAPVEQPQAAPEPQVQPAPVAEPRPEAAHVPITALLEERERRQSLESQLRAMQQQVQQQQNPPPDPNEDWQGWVQHQQAQVQQSVISNKLQISEDIAIERFGEQLVREADAWAMEKARQMPGLTEHLIAQRNPYGYLVQMYQREQALEKLKEPAEVDQFLAWRAAQAAAQGQQPAALATPQQPSPPPRSIASLPSAGAAKPGEQPVGPGVAFDSTFTR